MGLQQSLDAAVLVLADAKGDRFVLSCSCGWDTFESRLWVNYRIERHFISFDANENEQVTVKEVPDA